MNQNLSQHHSFNSTNRNLIGRALALSLAFSLGLITAACSGNKGESLSHKPSTADIGSPSQPQQGAQPHIQPHKALQDASRAGIAASIESDQGQLQQHSQRRHKTDRLSETRRMASPEEKAKGRSGASAQALYSLPASPHDAIGWIEPMHRENYHHFKDNAVVSTRESPVSTFSIDVDTGSYANIRRMLNQGLIPQRDAVRAEELINYFSYRYPYPQSRSRPFSMNTEIAPSPWSKGKHLLHIGLQAYQSTSASRPASNLVFLVDVSGSMHSRDKLELLKSGLKLLVSQLNENDRISLVTYAGSTGVVLKPTAGNQHGVINQALQQLTAGGSTNGASGIELAYQMARQSYIKGGINRVILATDGDFNVGITNFQSLKQMVEQKRSSGVSLTTLGFGRGNYNDHLMEQLADAGNGNYSYIDNLNEARKVLVEQMNSTLNTVASDVKIQIEFNPQHISEYRLIGYENRALAREDFNNDKVDAGEIGENHSVTALYEIVFTESAHKAFEPVRYQSQAPEASKAELKNEIAYLKIRYKPTHNASSQLIEQAIYKKDVLKAFSQASENLRFAAAVAAFAQQLRGAKYLQNFSFDDILKVARDAKGDDAYGYRGEFIQLVALARTLTQASAN